MKKDILVRIVHIRVTVGTTESASMLMVHVNLDCAQQAGEGLIVVAVRMKNEKGIPTFLLI